MRRVTGSDRSTCRTRRSPFYNIPEEAADRTIERYEVRQKNPDASDDWVDLLAYVYKEIHLVLVIFVGGAPLAEYHGRAGLDE